MAKVNGGEWVDPSQYYFRTAVAFETAAPQYAWLNGIIAVGTGSRPPEGPAGRQPAHCTPRGWLASR